MHSTRIFFESLMNLSLFTLVYQVCRHTQIDLRPLACAAPDGESRADSFRTFAHAGNSMVTLASKGYRTLVHATPVILNRDPQVPLAVAQENANPGGVSMLERIGNRLPADLQNVIPRYRIQKARMTFDQNANLASAFGSKSVRCLRESLDEIIRAQGQRTQVI